MTIFLTPLFLSYHSELPGDVEGSVRAERPKSFSDRLQDCQGRNHIILVIRVFILITTYLTHGLLHHIQLDG